MQHLYLFSIVLFSLTMLIYSIPSHPIVFESEKVIAASPFDDMTIQLALLQDELTALESQLASRNKVSETKVEETFRTEESPRTVPFYSQFNDISAPNWQKVGCGIATTAMLIDYYSDDTLSVDGLLNRGIAAGAFLSDAGWTHQGLINLTHTYGLDGESHSLAHLSPNAAFQTLTEVLQEGPVMASVYYTMTPGHPIPHLIVVNDVKDGLVYYNDPADPQSGSTISIEKFKPAWKQRYIEIRPTT